MPALPVRPPTAESRTLAHGNDFALLTLLVPGLPNSLLVQLHRASWRLGGGNAVSLYALYRESTMVFDAIVRFDLGDSGEALDTLLHRFVAGDAFEAAVLKPLAREVRRHFAR